MYKLETALYFYAILIAVCAILGVRMKKDNQILGFLNGLALGLVISIVLYNNYANKLA